MGGIRRKYGWIFMKRINLSNTYEIVLQDETNDDMTKNEAENKQKKIVMGVESINYPK